MNQMEMKKKIFELLRMIYLDKNKTEGVTNIQGVITLNEELNNVGYTISPKQIKELVCYTNEELAAVVEEFNYLLGDVLAKPMYPNFPTDVWTIEETVFRADQMLHYASTYGIDGFNALFGTNIDIPQYRPNANDTEKTVSDKQLLDYKVIEIGDLTKFDGFYTDTNARFDWFIAIASTRITCKRERATEKELDLLKDILDYFAERPESVVKIADLFERGIPFKENMIPFAFEIMKHGNCNAKAEALYYLCDHPGDLFKVLDAYLKEKSWNLSTSEKKSFVKALEKFVVPTFKENLMRSNDQRERVLKMLKALDYNKYSRSLEHENAVCQLRNKEFMSWYGKLEKEILASNMSRVKHMLTCRPTEYLRSMYRLLTLGYAPEDIAKGIAEISKDIPMQTLVSVYNAMIDKCIEASNEMAKLAKGFSSSPNNASDLRTEIINRYNVKSIVFNAIENHFKDTDLGFRGKKVYVDQTGYDLTASRLIINKSQEAGYIRPGIVYKIPDDVKVCRFFCYWNDSNNKYVDIDLHSYMMSIESEEKKCSVSHVGWNGKFRDDAMATSGDLTRSDSAEYIDIDLTKIDKDNKLIATNISVFSGGKFSDIETVFTGMMAVNSINENVKLYDAKNCFWYNNLNSSARALDYALINPHDRLIAFIGNEVNRNATNYASSESFMNAVNAFNSYLTVGAYLGEVFKSQNAEVVDTKEEADVVIVVGKPSSENEISLIDNNFFMDK